MPKKERFTEALDLIFLNIRNRNITFEFDNNLVKFDPTSDDVFKILPEDTVQYITSRHHPTILPIEKNRYRLMAGHILYRLLHARSNKEHPIYRFWRLNDPGMTHIIQSNDSLEQEYILRLFETAIKPYVPSDAKMYRDMAFRAGNTCPKCTRSLHGPTNRLPIDPTSPCLMYRVTCFNSHQRTRKGDLRCDFRVDVTDYEFQRFPDPTFTSKGWIYILHNATCPKENCGGLLFVRSIHNSADDIQKYVICQYAGLSVHHKCDFCIPLDQWQPKLNI